MATTAVNGVKRQHPDDEQHSAQKRSRATNGSSTPQTNGTGNATKPDINQILADARAKAAATAARLSGATPSSGAPPQGSATDSAQGAPSSIQDRIAQIKARIAAAGPKASTPPTRTAPAPPPLQPPAYDDGMSRGRGGLDVGLHPALLGDAGQDAKAGRGKQSIQPKFATTMANRRTESPLPLKSAKPTKQLDLSVPSIEET